jgi:hypothetical protein
MVYPAVDDCRQRICLWCQQVSCPQDGIRLRFAYLVGKIFFAEAGENNDICCLCHFFMKSNIYVEVHKAIVAHVGDKIRLTAKFERQRFLRDCKRQLSICRLQKILDTGLDLLPVVSISE